MNTHLTSKIYNTDIYVRLSREDGDKIESDSIVNQKEFIKNFLKNKPEFKLHQIRVDDGYTGVNFQRPSFIKMLDDIKAGKVNCVVVKDLSRFGRNYIEAGKYITNIFPFLNVRFIAINDNFDTADIQKNNSQLIYVHFKNLMNDAYCNDISVKTRSSLDIKCRNGNFLSAYAPYGYLKSPDNKNKLIIDESVKETVSDIFNWKLAGMSALRIAERLNSLGIASPMEHKREIGIDYKSAQKTHFTALWSAKAVTRILRNKVYIGVLEQHKTTTPNYKIKVRTEKPKDEWIVTENSHEPIIDEKLFYIIQNLMNEDTRVSPKNESLHILSGILKCGKCGCNMTRKKVVSSGREFYYYVCSDNKNRKNCDNSVTISVKKFEKAILEMLNISFLQFTEVQRVMKTISSLPFHNTQINRLNKEIDKNIEQIEINKKYSLGLYEDLKSHLINEKDYKSLKQMYSDRIDGLNLKIEKLKREIDVISSDRYSEYAKYAEKGRFEKLTREVIVTFIDRIFVFGKERIEADFKFQSDYEIMRNYINNVAKNSVFLSEKEAE